MGLKNLHFPTSHSKAEAAGGARLWGPPCASAPGPCAEAPLHSPQATDQDTAQVGGGCLVPRPDTVRAPQCPCLSRHLSRLENLSGLRWPLCLSSPPRNRFPHTTSGNTALSTNPIPPLSSNTAVLPQRERTGPGASPGIEDASPRTPICLSTCLSHLLLNNPSPIQP